MPSVDILACRDHSTVSDPLNPIYLAGFCAVGVVVLSLAIWLLIHFWRKHSATKREESRGAAFLSVRGLVSEQDEKGQWVPFIIYLLQEKSGLSMPLQNYAGSGQWPFQGADQLFGRPST